MEILAWQASTPYAAKRCLTQRSSIREMVICDGLCHLRLRFARFDEFGNGRYAHGS